MTDTKKDWMLGLPGHKDAVTFDQVALLIRGGQVRETDMLKRIGQPWRAAGEIPELTPVFKEAQAAPNPKPPPPPPAPAPAPAPEAPKTERRESRLRPLRPLRPLRRSAEREETKHPEAAEAKAPEPALPPPPPRDTAVPESAPPPPPAPRPARHAPPAAPTIEPMVVKYFSPTDLLRAITYSFAPGKIGIAAALLVPTAVVATLLTYLTNQYLVAEGKMFGARILQGLTWTIAIYGAAFVTMLLAFMTRRQVEGSAASLKELVAHAIRNLVPTVIYPLGALVPALLLVGLLAVLGWVRNTGDVMATVLRYGYVVPLIVGVLVVLVGLALQISMMYFPASFAVEGAGLSKAGKGIFYYLRTQTGRVILHWLLITAMVWFTFEICWKLMNLAHDMPVAIFPKADADKDLPGWDGNAGVQNFYIGLCLGIAALLPASVFATLGVLSFLVLKQEDIEYTTTEPASDTDSVQGAPAGPGPAPGETQPTAAVEKKEETAVVPPAEEKKEG